MTDTFDPLSIYGSPAPANTDEAQALLANEPERPEPEPRKPSGAKRGRKPGRSQVLTAIKVLRLSASRRELLARLCGLRGFSDKSDDDVVRLVVATAESPLVGKVLARVLEISETTDALECGYLAAELSVDKTALVLAFMAIGAEDKVPTSRPGLALAQEIKAASPSALGDVRALDGVFV